MYKRQDHGHYHGAYHRSRADSAYLAYHAIGLLPVFTLSLIHISAQPKVYLFSGFLRCADCGKAMNRKTISQPYRNYYYYICSTFKKQHSGACTKHKMCIRDRFQTEARKENSIFL